MKPSSRSPSPPLILTRWLIRSQHRPVATAGFTLVELLLGVAFGSIVLWALGGVLLISQMRVASTMQRYIESVDTVNRAVDLIRKEVTYSGVVTNVFSLANPTAPTTDCDDNLTSLAMFRGPETICYKSIPIALLPTQYQNIFEGPCVLIRVGPPYKTNGDLVPSSSIAPNVLLDRLGTVSSNCKNALQAKVGLSASTALSSKSRNADMTLSIKIKDSPATFSTYSFSTSVPSNPAYGGYDLYAVANCDLEKGCSAQDNASSHFKLNEDTDTQIVTPTVASKENIVYFKYPFDNYLLQGSTGPQAPCTYYNCLVTRQVNGGTKKVQLYKIDSLVFTDREFRPSS